MSNKEGHFTDFNFEEEPSQAELMAKIQDQASFLVTDFHRHFKVRGNEEALDGEIDSEVWIALQTTNLEHEEVYLISRFSKTELTIYNLAVKNLEDQDKNIPPQVDVRKAKTSLNFHQDSDVDTPFISSDLVFLSKLRPLITQQMGTVLSLPYNEVTTDLNFN